MRERHLASLAVGVVLLAMAGDAAAMALTRDGPRWGVELQFGPYRPHISEQAENRALYRQIFASGKSKSLFEHQPLMKTFEFEYYVDKTFGLIGVSGQIGHWSVSGSTLRCADASGAAVECSGTNLSTAVPGADKANLTVVPLGLGAVYRMDLLKRQWGIPVVLHARAGLDYHLWWASAGGKLSRRTEGTKKKLGRGGTLGFSGAAGIALGLDWLEPKAATRGRNASGMAGSYLLAEATRFVADGFGDEGRLDMSDTVFFLGLAVDFL